MSVWDELVGQARAVAQLQQAAAQPEAMTHAWLITGPPGSGRSLAARAFAAALECTDPAVLSGDLAPGCGHCKGCTTTMAGTNPDVTVFATDKVIIPVDDVRELVTESVHTPSVGRWRVMIVEDSDRMAERSTNVLLKAVEEPPPATVWVLCAPSARDVLPTIRSRCRQVVLQVPTAGQVAELLVRRDGIGADVALTAALAAQSHVGRARHLARTPGQLTARAETLALVARISTVPDAVVAAGKVAGVIHEAAEAESKEREAQERSELFRVLGINPTETVPSALRGQVRELEADQKRRAKRRENDLVDRFLVDLMSLYRDGLVIQLGADVVQYNEASASGLAAAIAARSAAREGIARLDAIDLARRQLSANVPVLLVLEALFVSIVPRSGAGVEASEPR